MLHFIGTILSWLIHALGWCISAVFHVVGGAYYILKHDWWIVLIIIVVLVILYYIWGWYANKDD